MLTDEQIAALATDLESDRVERKASVAASAHERVGQAICAFSNDLPGHGVAGYVLVGVTDDGRPAGLKINDRLLQSLASYRSEGNILPIPSLVVEKRILHGQEIAVVEVQPSHDPPVRYYGQVWIRVGPRRALASRDEERALAERRRSGDLAFDQRAAGSTTLADLDLDFFRTHYLPAAVSAETLAANGRDVEEQLAALHLLSREGAPTHAAVLLLGRDPRGPLPGAYVQFARFDGPDLSSPILDQKEIDGRVSDTLRLLDDLAAVNIRTATEVQGHTVERRRPDYSLTALQQVLRNAVLHRTYEVNAPVSWYWFDDRVEIHSPGGLYGRVTPENFGQPYATDYRNPTLAQGLKILGFVQRFGMGIALTRSSSRANDNPDPEFQFSTASLLAVLRRRP